MDLSSARARRSIHHGIIPCMRSITIPTAAHLILSQLLEHGFDAYIVGGGVRDVLMGAQAKDWDFTTNATPPQLLELFPDAYYNNEFGTVGLAHEHLAKQFPQSIMSYNSPIQGNGVYEITTFRKDFDYTNNRKPDRVEWGERIEEDLERRDFSMNAIALKVVDSDKHVINPQSESIDVQVEVVDPFDGMGAIKTKTIVAVGKAHDRFSEDALRMMRAIRFGAQLGFTIETQTLQAIKDNHELINRISFERIRDELLKILASPFPADGIMLLLSSGLLEHIVPEMLKSQGVMQGGRHKFDVWKHSLESLRECPSTDPVVKLATWLHDVGKPATQKFEGPRGVTFYGHEVVGARMARDIARRLRLSNKDIDRVFTLVRWHMFTYSPEMTDAAVRRFIKRVGRENINDMIMLRIGDRKGGGSNATSWRLRELQQRIGENLYEPMSLKDLAINGTDLMEALQLQPGKKVGEILSVLFEEVIEEPERNNTVYLLDRAKELL